MYALKTNNGTLNKYEDNLLSEAIFFAEELALTNRRVVIENFSDGETIEVSNYEKFEHNQIVLLIKRNPGILLNELFAANGRKHWQMIYEDDKIHLSNKDELFYY